MFAIVFPCISIEVIDCPLPRCIEFMDERDLLLEFYLLRGEHPLAKSACLLELLFLVAEELELELLFSGGGERMLDKVRYGCEEASEAIRGVSHEPITV